MKKINYLLLCRLLLQKWKKLLATLTEIFRGKGMALKVPIYKERGEGRTHMRHTLGYVNHMLRMYARKRGKQSNFQKEIDRRNFQTVEKVLNDLPEWDRNCSNWHNRWEQNNTQEKGLES